ncbi:TraB/GumN family protein [Methanothermococcus sp. SCGC AD-155-M21]|nr:TraB/GumN family protein [Methanothermococcus sp. SCGC AD-155-M21]
MHIKINNGFNDCDIYLIGTAHVSEDSVNKVEQAILEIDPDLIAIELDNERFFALLNENGDKNHPKKNIDLLKIIKEGNIGLFLIHSILANFQRDIGEKFNIKPGSEMKKAVELAKTYKKPLSLIDRPINITLKRALDSMSLKEKLTLLYGLLDDKDTVKLDKESLNKMVDNAEELTNLLNELSPSLYRVLVDERDRYMAKNIFDITSGRERILVVVGAGHVNGIVNYLKKLEKNEIDININELMELKKKKNYFKMVFSILLIGIIVYGIYSISSNPEALKILTIEWILINGGLSALGVILARGKFPSIIAAFLAAPITSLIPVIGAGYVVGAVELKYRKITPEDISQFLKTEDLKVLMNNNLMRVLMVVALSSIGSAIGTFYFIPRFLGV